MNRDFMRFITKAMSLALALGVLQWAQAAWLDRLNRENQREKINWVCGREGRHVGVLMLGDSTAKCSIDGKRFSETLGETFMNLGRTGTAHPGQYLMLDTYLKGNTADTLILSTHAWQAAKPSSRSLRHEYAYLPWVSDPRVYATLSEEFGLKAALWKHLPGYGYIEFNTDNGLSKATIMMQRKIPEWDQFGCDIKEGYITERPISINAPTAYGITQKKLDSLRKMIELGTSRQMKVVLLVTPCLPLRNANAADKEAAMAAFRALADEYQITLVNCAETEWCDDPLYYYDIRHVNQAGAQKITDALIDALQ